MNQNSTHLELSTPEKTAPALRSVPFSSVPRGWHFEYNGEIYLKLDQFSASLPDRPSVAVLFLSSSAQCQIL